MSASNPMTGRAGRRAQRPGLPALCGLALTCGAISLLLLPPAGRAPSAARPATGALYPRYAQATTPLDDWQQRTAPVLVANQPWEQGVVEEPTVLYDQARRRYQMWYTGGWTRTATGYATSGDGLHWAKHVGPVLGLGHGGFSGSVARNSVLRLGGRYLLFFVPWNGDGAVHLAESMDGVHWQAHAAPVLRVQPEQRQLANTAVWVEGAHWHMIYEALGRDGLWRLGLAAGTSAEHWHSISFGLRSLQVGRGAYGGPMLHKVGRTYNLWYHAARAGNLATDIYHAQSTDLVHWRVLGRGPVLARALSWEVDQTADPCLVTDAPSALRLLFFSGMDNAAPHGAIGVAASSRALAHS